MSKKTTKSGGVTKPEPEVKKPRAQTAATPVTSKTAAKKSAPAKSAAKKAPAKKAAAKTATKRTSAAGSKATPARRPGRAKAAEIESDGLPLEIIALDDPIGDTTDGEAQRLLGAADTSSVAEASAEQKAAPARRPRESKSRKKPAAVTPEPQPEPEEAAADEQESAPAENREQRSNEPGPEPHLERLQKILSQSGVASRRHAEEMIVAGRVVVNGQTVTQLGAKADAARDHIRVDGKLLQTTVRLRTFMLNKPKGFVTTVSDPEGRPTVMNFFEKVHERLYPVGRLDFQSEGLLLLTNDGELANALTRAAAGVEKIYVVKIAGQPNEEDIERLRQGISIERGDLGSDRVRTAPAHIRQIRRGDNPWYEVVLTEGRNRELRKMFQAIGHYVEKIRRVAYGPLTLDVEPGQIRELTAEEVNALRLTAEGKLKPKRPKSSNLLPKEAGLSTEERQRGRGGRDRFAGPPRREFGAREERPFRPREEGSAPARDRFPEKRFGGEREQRSFGGPARGGFAGPRGDRPQGGPPRGGFGARPPREGDRGGFGGPRGERPERSGPARGGFGERPQREGGRSSFGGPRGDRPQGGPSRGGFGGPRGDRPERSGPPRGGFGDRPPREGGRAGFGGPRGDRPERSAPPRSGFGGPREDRPQGGPPRTGFGAPRGDRPQRSSPPRTSFGGPREDRGERREPGSRPFGGRPQGRGGPGGDRPRFDRERRPDRPAFGGDRPRAPRPESGSEERPPRREFRPREEGAPRTERPGGGFGGNRNRPPSRPGQGRPSQGRPGQGRPGGNRGSQGRGPGSGGRPGGFRKSGPPRRDRG
jgi:pseudouridine synthase